MKTPSDIQVPFRPTWMNTLNGQPDAPHISGHVHGWQRPAEDAAWNAGYSFLLWNGRVYFLKETETQHMSGYDTGWTKDDVDLFTANHPDIERIHNYSKESW